MNKVTPDSGWMTTKSNAFWDDIATSDHIVQIYDSEAGFLETLAGFAGAGINAGDSIVIVATRPHLNALEERLTAHGIHIPSLIANHLYFPYDAEETLSKIMVDNSPDEELFMQAVNSMVRLAKAEGRSVRAFGEMVVLLWQQGNKPATIKLENLWNKFCSVEALQLFCAYPRSVFTGDAEAEICSICASHSRQIRETHKPITEIHYKSLAQELV